MNLAFVVNQNYIGQLKVTLHSIRLSNPEQEISVHLLYSGFTKEDREDLDQFLEKRKFRAEYYLLGDELFEGLPKMTYDESYTAYYKVLIPYLLEKLPRVLFLDCDIVVKGDLSSLYERKTTAFLSAVKDERVNKKHFDHVKKITGGAPYFNSGVMLFDFSHSDEIAPREEVFSYLQTDRDKIRWHDQDVLNHFYAEKCDFIDCRYNYTTVYSNLFDILFRFGAKKAVVVHYANWKPWKNYYPGKCYGLYRKRYFELSGERRVDFLEKRTLKDRIRFCLKYIRR